MGGGGVARPCLFLTSAAPINQLRTRASTGPLLLLLFFFGGVYSWVINPSWVLPLL
jgi:hypothetical protein